MQPALPVVRTCSSLLSQQCSRIPHIEYHILRRAERARSLSSISTPRSRSTACSTPNHARIQQHRSKATLAYGDRFAIDGTTQDPDPAFEHPEPPSPPTTDEFYSSLEKIYSTLAAHKADTPLANVSEISDAQETRPNVDVERLIQEAHPERLFSWLTTRPSAAEFIVTAGDDDFDKVFCLLDPEVLAEPYKARLRFIRPQGSAAWRRPVQRLMGKLHDFERKISKVMAARQKARGQLSIATVQHGLKVAASAGNLGWAEAIWKSHLTMTGPLKPNIDCFNSYMQAINWNLGYRPSSQSTWRNTAYNLEWRKKEIRPISFKGYNLIPGSETNIKAAALRIFERVSESRAPPNERTFVELITAFARAADLESVESILKSVWNIDLPALDAFDEEEIQSPTFYPDGHALKPTDKLLFAVVHAFAINHQVPKARKLLDYVSRNYNLPIPASVWDELAMWTYVYTVPRSKHRRKQEGPVSTKLESTELEQLFSIITDEPYNMGLTPMMHSYRLRNLRNHRHLTLDTVKSVESSIAADLDHFKAVRNILIEVARDHAVALDNGLPSVEFLRVREAYLSAYYDLRVGIDQFCVELGRMTKTGRLDSEEWRRRDVSKCIDAFTAYLPTKMLYQTSSGYVTISTASTRDAYQRAHGILDLFEESAVLATLLDVTDLDAVTRLLRAFDQVLANPKAFEGQRYLPKNLGLEQQHVEEATAEEHVEELAEAVLVSATGRTR